MPATWVVEGEIVNFHSDLQRPFLSKTIKYTTVSQKKRTKYPVELHMHNVYQIINIQPVASHEENSFLEYLSKIWMKTKDIY